MLNGGFGVPVAGSVKHSTQYCSAVFSAMPSAGDVEAMVEALMGEFLPRCNNAHRALGVSSRVLAHPDDLTDPGRRIPMISRPVLVPAHLPCT